MHIITQDQPINLFDAVMAHKDQQMKTPTVDFKTPLTTIAQAKAWIEALTEAGMMFHFEDSPETIINGTSDKPLFTKAEAKDVRKRVGELYALDWTVTGHECPIGYALEVMEPERKPTLDNLTEEYSAFILVHRLPEADAMELIHLTTLTDYQRRWISTFIRRWEAVEQAAAA